MTYLIPHREAAASAKLRVLQNDMRKMSERVTRRHVNIGPLWRGVLFEWFKAAPSPRPLQCGAGAVSDRWKKTPGRECPEKATVKPARFAR